MRKGIGYIAPRNKWEIENDAHILLKAAEITSDRNRLADAKEFTRRQLTEQQRILKIEPTTPLQGKENKATLGRLPTVN